MGQVPKILERKEKMVMILQYPLRIFLIVLSFSVSEVKAVQSLGDVAARMHVELDKGNLTVLEPIQEMPTGEAVQVLRLLVRRYKPFNKQGNQQVYLRCIQIRRALPDVELWYEAELALQSKRNPWELEMASTAAGELATLQNRRALEILAKYLKTPKPIYHRRPGDDTPEPDWLARDVVRSMYNLLGVANLPPLKRSPNSYLTDDEVTRVAEWWEANKHQPDSFFFPSVQSTGSPKLNDSQKATSGERRDTALTASGQQSAVPKGKPINAWVIVGMISLVLLGAIFTLWRRFPR